MEPAVAVGYATTDEALRTASQCGIKNVVVYSGPGSSPPLDYQAYVALRMRIESFGLKLVAIEGGFSPHRRYYDVIFGGPRRDELIDELLDGVRAMARAGIPIWGYNWMPNSWGRGKPTVIRGGAFATGYQYDWEKERRPPTLPGQTISEELMWDALEYWIKAVTPCGGGGGDPLWDTP
jgi:mannonate dehydratase